MVKKPKLSKTGKPRQLDPRGIVRGEKARVKTARYRKSSSTRWLHRQLNDPYVAAAKRDGYRSRAAYKLIELDEKFNFLHGANSVVDLGAAPGGWTQVAVERAGRGNVVAIDILEMDPVDGAVVLQGDMTDPVSDARILNELGGPPDIILSDMAAATTGHRQTDHLRTMALCEAAVEFAMEHLAQGGTVVAKVFQGGAQAEFLARIKPEFEKIRHIKPDASRKESPETYLVAQGYKKNAG